MLDQQIAPAWPVGQQSADFFQRQSIDLTALGGLAGLAAATARTVKS
jgi:hypothetical protein